MSKKKRAKHRSRRRKAQPFAKPSAARPAVARDRASASESSTGVEAVTMFDPTPLERKAERDQERRVWEQVDKAP